MINTFEKNKIVNLLEVGLDTVTYDALMTSYLGLNDTLTQPGQNLRDEDRESFKYVYKYRELFANVLYPYSEVKGWLKAASMTALEEFGMSEQLIEYTMLQFDELLDGMETEQGNFDFQRLLFGEDLHAHSSYTEWALSLTW